MQIQPRDNCEEPRNTPDALRTGTAGKNLAPVTRNQTRSAPHNNNNVPFSHSDGRAQDQPNRGQLGSQPRGQYNGSQQGPKQEIKLVLLPEANKLVLILVFLLGDSNMLILMKVLTGDILPPHSLLLDLITQWPVTLLVGPSFS